MRKQDRLGDSWLESGLIESSFTEKEIGLPANKKLSRSQHYAYKQRLTTPSAVLARV